MAGNLCFHWEAGDRAATDAAFARAAHVTRIAVVNNRVVVSAMEPRGSVGSYDRGTRRYTLHTVNQGPHMHRSVIAGILGPLSLLIGLWQVNFPNIPGSGWGFGWPTFVGLLLVLIALGVWSFHRRGML